MRISYVANHGQTNSNDDEGAVTNALTLLGHEVRCVQEASDPEPEHLLPADLVLFHKWAGWSTMDRLRGRARLAFWYFDLVDHPDPVLAGRCANRRAWMAEATPRVDAGFCTDGDWAALHPDKLIHLTQGADQRHVRHAEASDRGIPILFTGTRRGGADRERFVDEMTSRWGSKFRHVSHGLHGPALATAIATAAVVVAPPSPVTDLYCSNRAYLILGRGGLLLHPRCATLQSQYEDGREVLFYGTVGRLHTLIERWLAATPFERMTVRDAGLRRTQTEHTYLHRCRTLIAHVEGLDP